MKRGDYLEVVLDALEEDLHQMGVDDDYETYGSTKTNVDDESVVILVDFPGGATRAFVFPYDENLKKAGIMSEFNTSQVRQKIQDEVLEDAAKRCVLTNSVQPEEEADYDEEEDYDDDYDDYDDY